jgi:hypothetical protein
MNQAATFAVLRLAKFIAGFKIKSVLDSLLWRGYRRQHETG